jgi:hypothetical protein
MRVGNRDPAAVITGNKVVLDDRCARREQVLNLKRCREQAAVLQYLYPQWPTQLILHDFAR